MSHSAENDVPDAEEGFEMGVEADPDYFAENDRTPHTHGGTDAPECTLSGVHCRPAKGGARRGLCIICRTHDGHAPGCRASQVEFPHTISVFPPARPQS